MQLTPRYDQPDFLRLDVPLDDPAAPMVRQRRRLAAVLADLGHDQWATASRCEGWSVRDVLAHLVSTNQFWSFAIRSARQGEPTRFLATFDPVASPAQLVEDGRSQTPAEVLAAYVDTTEQLAGAVAGLDADGWALLGEAPPGHVPLAAVVLHALWDGWVHERDVLLPLRREQVEEPDEVAACLWYVAALSPALAVAGGSTQRGTIAVRASNPDTGFVVEVGEGVVVRLADPPADALLLTGDAIELVEGLSFRAPLPCPVPEERAWLLGGLAAVFDQGA